MPYATIPAGTYDADSPITDEFLDSVVGNEDWLKALLESHTHDGVDTTEIEVGPNYLRNPSFESDTTGWTTTAYTGGSVAISTTNDMHGAKALAITSSVFANGGGEAYTTGYTPVAAGIAYDAGAMIKASVTGQSVKVAVIWYDDAKLQISESAIYITTSERTAAHMVANRVVAPNTARFARVKLFGGVPGSGSATGTIYFDGVFLVSVAESAIPGTVDTLGIYPTDTTPNSSTNAVVTASTSYVEVLNYLFQHGGVYSVSFSLANPDGTNVWTAYGRIYVDGVATGTERTTTSSGAFVEFTEDILIPAGSTMQIFAKTNGASDPTSVSQVKIRAGNCPKMIPINSVSRITNGLRY